MLKHESLIRDLFLASPDYKKANTILNRASIEQVKILIYLLFYIVNGKIPVNDDTLKFLKHRNNNRRVNYLWNNLSSKENLINLLSEPQQSKKKFLSRQLRFLDKLFFRIFNPA